MSPSTARVSTAGLPAGKGQSHGFGTLLDLAPDLKALTAVNAAPEVAYRARPRSAPRPTGRANPSNVRGHPKFCSICDRAFGHFGRFGLARRKNAQCPGCGSLERHRFLWLYLDRVTRLARRRLRVLHFAPEGCLRKRLAALPGITHIAADLYRPDATHRLDITDLALPDRSIDLVLCSHVLEHVEDDDAALREIGRVLVPNGRAIIMVPLDLQRKTVEDAAAVTAAERMAAFGHPYHVRICGNDYEDRIASAGFSVRRVDSADLPPHRRRYHRLNKLSLFDCHPQPAARTTAP